MKESRYAILAAVGALLLLGILSQASLSVRQEVPFRLIQHVEWIMVGALAAVVACFVPLNWVRQRDIPRLLFAASLVLLLLVLIPGIGSRVHGASRWLFIGQPSELAKLAAVFALADYMARRRELMIHRDYGFLFPLGAVAVVSILIFAEPDWGTAALITLVALAMLYLGGTEGFYLASTMIIGFEMFVLLLLQNQVRMTRVISFTDPEKYADGPAWQIWHGLIALGVGGPLGAFIGGGIHKYGFVPEQQTDFILTLVGEELGFAGCCLVIALFGVLIFCGARIAWKVEDAFGKYLASGITLLLSMQALINIAVVTSSIPNKGLPLPFMSYGGSNIVCMMAAVGLLLNVARNCSARVDAPVDHPRPTAPDKSGPVGSLLDDPYHRAPRGLRAKIKEWFQSRRRRQFPAAPRHDYQKPARSPG